SGPESFQRQAHAMGARRNRENGRREGARLPVHFHQGPALVGVDDETTGEALELRLELELDGGFLGDARFDGGRFGRLVAGQLGDDTIASRSEAEHAGARPTRAEV